MGSSLNPSRSATPQPSAATGYGSGNEAFFERMGNANAARSADLPPSQGGRYAGFGSTYEPEPIHPTSSQAVPTFSELQANPLGALSKGWGLFSTAVASSAREINASVVQPGMARASEYAAGAQAAAATRSAGGGGAGGESGWGEYLNTGLASAKAAGTWAGARATEGWSAANDLAKQKGGVDLNEQLGKLGLGGGNRQGRYGHMDRAEDGLLSPHGAARGKDDFFDEWDDTPSVAAQSANAGVTKQPAAPALSGKPAASAAGRARKDSWGNDDDGWKDF